MSSQRARSSRSKLFPPSSGRENNPKRYVTYCREWEALTETKHRPHEPDETNP
jgi:hypothetical protein